MIKIKWLKIEHEFFFTFSKTYIQCCSSVDNKPVKKPLFSWSIKQRIAGKGTKGHKVE